MGGGDAQSCKIFSRALSDMEVRKGRGERKKRDEESMTDNERELV